MSPNDKEWWRQKQHNDYTAARDRFHEEQMKRSSNKGGGGGGCLIFILLPFAALAIIAATKIFS